MAPNGADVEKQEPKASTSMSDTELGETIHSNGHDTTVPQGQLHPHLHLKYYATRQRRFWRRLRGKDRPRVPSWLESGKNIATSSYLNILFVCLPLAWVWHFKSHADRESTVFTDRATFALCFLSIIPLEKMFDWGGEQMALYLGKDLGDLVIITLNNAVEATLAIILLAHCELRILQSTLVGVVILHLLLIPGTAFLAGGAQIWEQNLHPHPTQLNHSLLIIGVLAILLPTAFFAALDRGALGVSSTGTSIVAGPLLSDSVRDQLLRMSRGVAVILLLVYIASRIFLANPPGEDNALVVSPSAPQALKDEEHHLTQAEPEVGPWACMLMLAITVGLMGATAEWLVESIEFVREEGGIQDEWFGLILLPVVSFSADGVVALVYFCRSVVNHFLGRKTMAPQQLAKARAIDLSIQFTLFWMPFLVLLAWWIGKPLHLMFDYFELALLLGACFLVNYVTADSKTNWVEGLIMVAFYLMIAVVAWFYSGQPEQEIMLACGESVAQFIASGGEEGGESTVEASEAALRTFAKIVKLY
ncbi:hypothetical protein QCA50_015072 [Cerrena zonata]|uniref:Sodium/calcium exchanger membrane region domain-containing protein n=1 Tax=Cerrena zonata TaxID=2478898 RepID=A0AAW0FS34_9APHY